MYPIALSASQITNHRATGTGSAPPAQAQLTVAKSGSGSGTVTSSDGKIACGSICGTSFNAGTTVTLNAAAAGGSTFGGWSGGGCGGTGSCVVTMNAAMTVTANFLQAAAPAQLTLTVSKSGTGGGTVTSTPAGITCGSTCSASFNPGATVTLNAAAAGGSTFGGWSGGGCGGTGSCAVTMNAATTVTATFSASGPAPAYTQAVTGDGPVGYWRLDESTGTTAADRTGSNPGQYRNGVMLGAPSLLTSDADKAASFSGASQMVVVPSSASLSLPTVVSVEAWIKPGALPTAGGFASIATKPESYSLQFNGPRMEFTIMQGGARRRVQAPLGAVAVGKASYVVGTYDGTTQRLYVDGTQVASTGLTGAITTNGFSFNIGSWNTLGEFFNGDIDEVAVYPGVLSAAQVANHRAAGTSTPAVPAVARHVAAPDGLGVDVRVPSGGTNPVTTAFDAGLDRIYVTRNADPGKNPNGDDEHASNGVTVIDGATRQAIAQIKTGRWSPSGVAVNPVTHLIYVTSATYGAIDDDSSVKVIDPHTYKIVRSIPVGPGPQGIAVNAATNRIYVTGQSGTDAGASVTVINGATNKVVGSIPIGSYERFYDNPSGLAVDSHTNTVYATNPLEGTLYVIDANTGVVARTVPIANEPTAIAVNETTGTVYVTNSGNNGNRISVVDGRSGAVTNEVATGPEPRGVAVDPLRNLVYVTSRDGNLSVVDGATLRVTQTVLSGENPYGVAVNPATRTVIVANTFGADVSIFTEPTRA